MHDCPEADIRDLLPDHAHGALALAERARVDAHLATCATCRAELALLRAVLAARPRVQAPDVARIVAALPAPAKRVRLVDSRVVSSDVGRAALPWRRIAGIAAVLVGVVGVGLYGRRGGEERGTPGVAVEPVVVADAPVGVQAPGATASTTPGVAPMPGARPPAPAAPPRASGGAPSDALGALGGVASGATDDELEALIGGLESLSGIPDVESVEGEESARTGGGER